MLGLTKCLQKFAHISWAQRTVLKQNATCLFHASAVLQQPSKRTKL